MNNKDRCVYYYKEDDYFVKMSDSCIDNSVRLGLKGFFIAGVLSAFPLQQLTKTHHMIEIIGRGLFKYAVPVGITGAILGGSISVLDDIRGKEKGITNAAIGGFLAGAFYGSRALRPWKTFQVGLLVSLASTVLRFFQVGGFGLDLRKMQLENINATLYLGDYKHLYPKN